MRSHVTGRGFIRVPDLMLHVDTVQAVITFPPPTRLEDSPSPIGDDFPDSNAFVPQGARKLVVILVRSSREDGHVSHPRPGLFHFGLCSSITIAQLRSRVLLNDSAERRSRNGRVI